MLWRRIFREAEAMDAAQIPDWFKRIKDQDDL